MVTTSAVDTGLHRQADRRLPAERLVPAGVCAEPDRQHRAAALPQRPRAGRDEQSPRRVELELPAVRRESQHGGGDRAGAAAGGGGQHRVPRAGAGVAGGAADDPERVFNRILLAHGLRVRALVDHRVRRIRGWIARTVPCQGIAGIGLSLPAAPPETGRSALVRGRRDPDRSPSLWPSPGRVVPGSARRRAAPARCVSSRPG
jgi:hypothetical protein